MLEDCLSKFVGDVNAMVLAACDQSRLDPSLRSLLRDSALEFFDNTGETGFAQPLGLFFATYRSLGKNSDQVTRLVGEFLTFYMLAGDAFDDVEDGDSERKPFGRDGVPIATNTSLMFIVLGLDALGRAVELCNGSEMGPRLFRVFNDVSITGVAAQHVDLKGQVTCRESILELHRGKASSLALLTECGAVVAGAAPDVALRFRDLGYKFAQIVQIVDDVRDLFGTDASSDLRQNKATYPLFCLKELVAEEEWSRYKELVVHCESADALRSIRDIYHGSGALDLCAEKVEELRHQVHGATVAFERPNSYHRILLDIVDALAGALYDPEPEAASATVRALRGPFAERLEVAATKVTEEQGLFTLDLPRPELRPWHLPFFLFSPSARCIYFPDLDGLGPEVLPFYGQILGSDLSEVQRLLPEIAPFFMAHEHVHARRFDLGLLGEDVWHEEVIANALALAYVQKHEPDVARALLGYVERLLSASPPSVELQEDAVRLLREGFTGPAPEGRDYGYSPLEAAQIYALHLRMMPRQSVDELEARYLRAADSSIAA
jgi:geranylgeranyl pyrophosphate synthase